MGKQWEGSDRRERLPRDWEHRRNIVRDNAGGRCEATMRDGSRCTERGTDCDHIVRGDNHALSNLQWLCGWHHNKKTAREALEARRSTSRPLARKATERHPGLR
ncbi:HNH endonuclease [Curtobacterium sp. AB451]|uniref:HNH endonuclease n=1 Tax=Curtobacterium sp. AB451 TaxID=3422306 RepID=UPI003D351D85